VVSKHSSLQAIGASYSVLETAVLMVLMSQVTATAAMPWTICCCKTLAFFRSP
jgi:hypothetical protein